VEGGGTGDRPLKLGIFGGVCHAETGKKKRGDQIRRTALPSKMIRAGEAEPLVVRISSVKALQLQKSSGPETSQAAQVDKPLGVL